MNEDQVLLSSFEKGMDANSEMGCEDLNIDSDSASMLDFIKDGSNIRGLTKEIVLKRDVKSLPPLSSMINILLIEILGASISPLNRKKLGGCKVALGWDPSVYRVVVLGMTNQVVYYFVKEIGDSDEFHSSFVYAENDHMSRRELWDCLRRHKIGVRNCPCIIMGDFNSTLNLSESLGGSSSVSRGMMEFCECVEDLVVNYINQARIMFTWNGKPHGNNGVLKKLDQVMGNSLFDTRFPERILSSDFWA
ncbi:hypothetical protein Pint_16142 [Pistacia integerrima]|uniref:Uncharacterized protein n=1 Tax=Pistacia integerrima TaxID=434235 RepID=A0ACC0ZCY0_9ROSI|nr:hypothetical protein Pint_16142 [Pistacia integerrima]